MLCSQHYTNPQHSWIKLGTGPKPTPNPNPTPNTNTNPNPKPNLHDPSPPSSSLPGLHSYCTCTTNWSFVQAISFFLNTKARYKRRGA